MPLLQVANSLHHQVAPGDSMALRVDKVDTVGTDYTVLVMAVY